MKKIAMYSSSSGKIIISNRKLTSFPDSIWDVKDDLTLLNLSINQVIYILVYNDH
jgi:hypothetical protein